MSATQRRRPASRPPTRTATRADLTAPDDIRRVVAAAASAVIPGLGQLINGRMRLARWFALPALLLVAIGILLVATNSPARLFASVISPTVMGLLLALNVVVLAWRLASVTHAFFDGRYAVRSGRAGAAGLVLVLAAVVVPHGVANLWGSSAQAAFASIFTNHGGTGPGQNVASASGPGANERLNILVTGVDSLPSRTETLTDSMMVVSIDPVGKTVSIVSLPRDIIRTPLGNGNVFGPKINSLMSYAASHPKQFPQGGMRTLEDAVGALLGIPIHYYARIDLESFVKLVDAVGGVDVIVQHGFNDPVYDGLGVNPPNVYGWSVTAGPHHFNGYEALAYARSRYAIGESDFTRAARQQELLLALRKKIMSGGDVLTRIPQLLSALGGFIHTDLPTDRLPDLAALADEMGATSVYRLVLIHPLVKPYSDPVLGSTQIPDLAAIRATVAELMPAPGQVPVVWTPDQPVPGTTAAPASAAP